MVGWEDIEGKLLAINGDTVGAPEEMAVIG
jgi:hypothetical protein